MRKRNRGSALLQARRAKRLPSTETTNVAVLTPFSPEWSETIKKHFHQLGVNLLKETKSLADAVHLLNSGEWAKHYPPKSRQRVLAAFLLPVGHPLKAGLGCESGL